MRQGDDIEINIRGKATIELKLGSACGLAPFYCGEVEVRETHRLFQLVGPIPSKKHQRHMSFVARYLSNEWLIAAGLLQKRNLVVQCNRPRCQPHGR
jgi:hypothetical protein